MNMQVRAKIVGVMVAMAFSGCGVSDGVDDSSDTPDLGESASPLALANPFYDRGTNCTVGGVSMHCCPSGTVMIGIHVSQNVLKCATLVRGFSSGRTLDAGTVRNDMHACPLGSLMVGIHVDRNLLTCQQSAEPVSLEFVDAVTNDSFPMHVCPGNLAMAGIRVDRNLLTCDQ